MASGVLWAVLMFVCCGGGITLENIQEEQRRLKKESDLNEWIGENLVVVVVWVYPEQVRDNKGNYVGTRLVTCVENNNGDRRVFRIPMTTGNVPAQRERWKVTAYCEHCGVHATVVFQSKVN